MRTDVWKVHPPLTRPIWHWMCGDCCRGGAAGSRIAALSRAAGHRIAARLGRCA